VVSSRASALHRPREDGLAHPADFLRPYPAAAAAAGSKPYVRPRRIIKIDSIECSRPVPWKRTRSCRLGCTRSTPTCAPQKDLSVQTPSVDPPRYLRCARYLPPCGQSHPCTYRRVPAVPTARGGSQGLGERLRTLARCGRSLRTGPGTACPDRRHWSCHAQTAFASVLQPPRHVRRFALRTA
jgi:hypothetical protein